MSYSFQTNVTSLIAQENLRVNSDFQAKTITRLTSGYRINSSGDDAAGLAVANGLRSNVAELTQGVRNANDGVSTLQIIDGGLGNISTILDRLKTLATQSASNTFTGNRSILNNEFQSLTAEVTRQAANIGLSTGAIGGANNTNLSVYIGGGNGVQANSIVNVNLGGSANRVDANALGLSSSSVAGGGSNDISAGADLRSGSFLVGGGTQTFTFNFAGVTVNATVGGGSAGLGGQTLVDQLNSQIGASGVNASIDATTGLLQFDGGSTAFTVSAGAASAGTGIAATNGNAQNTSLSIAHGQAPYVNVGAGEHEDLTFTIAGGSPTVVSLAAGTTIDQAIAQINGQVGSQGVYAVKNVTGDGIDLQGTSAFTVTSGGTSAATGVFATNTGAAQTVTAPAAGATQTGNATLALQAINQAVTLLGTVQGKVGAGENDLQYAIQLAQSQVSNFSAAESQIRDADIATEAANLTKAQVLEQSSVAALAQANSAPQALLKLLQ
jgi:flagellin